MILSKVIDTENLHALSRYNIREDSFVSRIERDVFSYIQDHVATNGGQTPSYATIVSEIPEFEYVPGVTDSFEFLSEKVKQRRAEYEFKRLVQDELPGLYEEIGKKDMSELTSLLTDRLEDIKMKTRTGVRLGTNIKENIDEFKSEYKRRQIGESHKVYKSVFPTIGEYSSGNIYTIYGKSGRGKSIITLHEATYLAKNGANVLIWSMEMGSYETVVRIYTALSAMIGIQKETIEGQEYNTGFDADQLRGGTLSSEMESEFFRMLDEIGKYIEGNITVRGVDDTDFTIRNLEQLKYEIEETQADIDVMDKFYYLDYKRNTSKTDGGNAAETSKKLRRLGGETDVVIFAITQADETDDLEDEKGVRIISPPERKDVAKTKQLLQDAALLIAVDTDYQQRLGVISLNKGRNGGEGDEAEIIYIPSKGIVKEIVFNPEMFNF